MSEEEILTILSSTIGIIWLIVLIITIVLALVIWIRFWLISKYVLEELKIRKKERKNDLTDFKIWKAEKYANEELKSKTKELEN
ncbi:MAG: hypothetical protein ACRCUM_03200 [Mycoplasmoidaceae bacterium]